MADDLEVVNLGEAREQVVLNPGAEGSALLAFAQILEGENGDAFLRRRGLWWVTNLSAQQPEDARA